MESSMGCDISLPGLASCLILLSSAAPGWALAQLWVLPSAVPRARGH